VRFAILPYMNRHASIAVGTVRTKNFHTSWCWLFGLLSLCGVGSAGAQPKLNAANGHYYEAVSVPASTTWTAARTAAGTHTYLGRTGHLVDITSQAENDFIAANLPAATAGNYWTGGYQDYTAADYSEPSGGWRWTTGQPFTFTNWNGAEPNNIEAAEGNILLHSSGKWNDAIGVEARGGYVVEYDTIAPVPTPSPQPTATPVYNPGNGHYYQAIAVAGGTTWDAARTAAVARKHLGYSGHLVAINSEAENQFVVTNLPNAVANNYYIGGSQNRNAPGYVEPSDGWQWVTDQPWGYTNWDFNEPNNGHPFEDHAYIMPDGQWNDVRGSLLLGGYIVEYDGPAPTPTATPVYNASNGHYYEAISAYELIGFEAAKTAAAARTYQGRTGRLVTLTSAAENNFVGTNFPAALTGQYWIGAFQDRTAVDFSEPAAEWRWLSGETWSYTNWNQNEPNNAYGGSPPEDSIYLVANGKWNDVRAGNLTNGYVVEYDGPIPTYQISGRISNAQGAAIVNATIGRAGSSATVQSNSAGYYTILVQPGSYTVSVTKAGYSFTPVNRTVNASAGNVANQNFVGRTGVDITGRIATSASVAIGGVTVTRTGSATAVVTNGAGYYTFVDVVPGSTTITASKAGYRFTPVNRTVTVGSVNVTGQNFIGATGYTLNGRIANSGGVGVGNIVVRRSGSNLTATTNGAGYYTFTDVPNGTYTITPSGAGLSFLPEIRTATVNNADSSNHNFTVTSGYSVSGRIANSSGVGLAGVTVTRTGSGTPVYTNGAGYFTFHNVANGSYTLLPSADGLAFTPVTKSVTVAGAAVSGQNFIGVAQ